MRALEALAEGRNGAQSPVKSSGGAAGRRRLFGQACCGLVVGTGVGALGISSYSTEMSCFERSRTMAVAMNEITAQTRMYQAMARLVL
jgi:hypothetical protein